MKKSITHYLIAVGISFLFVSNQAIAQNFIWGTSGGGTASTQGSDDETVKDIATDRNGNVYVLSQVMSTGLKVAGQSVTGYGSNNIMLASFKPNGVFRWVKIIGTGRGDNCHWLGVDGKDGVYLVGNVYKDNGPANIDKDATSPKNYQTNIIVKYDTAGTYQWHRHPEMDTFSNVILWGQSRTIAMDVAPSGNVYWLMQLPPGGYGNGALKVTDTGTYLIKYSPTGGFSYVKPELTMKGYVVGRTAMTVDEASNRFILGGTHPGNGTLIMGGVTQPSCVFIACYKLDGTFNWKSISAGVAEFFSRPVIDASGNIYQSGWSTKGFVFDSYTTSGGTGSTAFVMKFDKNGKVQWGKDANSTAACRAQAAALRNNNELIIAGNFAGLLEWPGYAGKFTTILGSNYETFITRFDTQNGAVLGMDLITSSNGYHELPARMTSDGKGNVYIGGEFTEKMIVTQKDTLVKNGGGQTDWFLVKYGNKWPVSVADHAASKVRVYPNPATEQITVTGITAGTTIQVINMLGQQVQQIVSKSEQEVFKTSAMVPGSYMLQLSNYDGIKEIYRIEKQ